MDDRIHEHRITNAGPISVSKARHHGSAWMSVAGEPADPRGSSYPEGAQRRSDNLIWPVERRTQGGAVRANVELRALPDALGALADQYGEDNLRLVVGFDT